MSNETYGRKSSDSEESKEELVPVPSFLYLDLPKAHKSSFGLSPSALLIVVGFWTLGLFIFTDSFAGFLEAAAWGLGILLVASIVLSLGVALWDVVRTWKPKPGESDAENIKAERNIAAYKRLYAMSGDEETSSVLLLSTAKFSGEKFYSLPLDDLMNRVALVGAFYYGLGRKNCSSGHAPYCSHRIPREMSVWANETVESLRGPAMLRIANELEGFDGKDNPAAG